MSVRGYKVIKIDHESIPSFSLWNDASVIELLNEYNLITDQTDEAGGLIELRCEEFRHWYKNEWKHLQLEEGYMEGFIKGAEAVFIQLLQDSKDEEFIFYYCY